MIDNIISAYVFAITKGSFDFKGRTSARHYSYFLIVLFLLMGVSAEVALYVSLFMGLSSFKLISVLAACVVFVIHSVAFLAILQRRMSDTGRYKSNLFLFLVLLAFFLFVIKIRGFSSTAHLCVLLALLVLLVIRLCFVKSAAFISTNSNLSYNQNVVKLTTEENALPFSESCINHITASIIAFDSIGQSTPFESSASSKYSRRHECCAGQCSLTGFFILSHEYCRNVDFGSKSFLLNISEKNNFYFRNEETMLESFLIDHQNNSVAIILVTASTSLIQVLNKVKMINKLGISRVRVFINLCEFCDSKHVVELYEMELRSYLTSGGYACSPRMIAPVSVTLSASSCYFFRFFS